MILQTAKKPRRKKIYISEKEFGIAILCAVLCATAFSIVFFILGRAFVRVPVIQIANQATGDWTKLDLSKYPKVSLFCGTPVGGYACSVNRVQPDMDKDAGTGILLVPYVNECVPDTPPAGSSHAPVPQHKEKQDSCVPVTPPVPPSSAPCFETRKLRAAR